MGEAVTTQALPLCNRSSDSVARHTDSVRLDGQRRNLPIQWLRGLAATMVLLCHTASYQSLILHQGTLQRVFGADFGYLGVALFFAISGYLMSIAIRVQSPFVFLMHRVLRIFPLYVLTCALAWGARSVFHPVAVDPLALLLVPFPGVDYTALTIEWTLIFEVAFYASLFWIAWATGGVRLISWIAAGWLCLIVVDSAVYPDPGTSVLLPFDRMLAIAVCAPMAAGLMLPSLLQRRIPWPMIAIAGSAGLAVGEHYPSSYQTCRWSYGLAAFCLLWLVLAVQKHGNVRPPGRLARAASRYGDYSYALYLCHVPIIQLIYSDAATRTIYTLWSVTVGVSLAFAIVFGELDLRIYRRLKAAAGRVRTGILRPVAIALAVAYALGATWGSFEYHRIARDDGRAQAMAQQIAASGPVATPQDVAQTMRKAGYREALELVGNVDRVEWLPAIHQMRVTAWALERNRHSGQTVYLAAFRKGAMVAAGSPDVMRYDVAHAYHTGLLPRRLTGKLLLFYADTCEAGGLAVVAFTSDMRFLILPDSVDVICR
jgi:peptidoglycan/LPS O-acetylase OafA/YrhL